MGVTRKRLSGPALLTATAATQYTVPASTKTTIRHLHFANEDTSARTVRVSIGTDAAGTRIYHDFSIAAGAVKDDYGPYTLEATEVLQAYADVTSKVTLTIDGEEATL